MQLWSLIRPELIFTDVRGSDASSVLRSLAERVTEAVPEISDPEDLYGHLLEREALGSTGIGSGVAIPHCKLGGIDQIILALGITRREIDFQAADEEPVRLFFVVVSPSRSPATHLQALAAISKWVKAEGHVRRILEQGESLEIFESLQQEQD